MVNRFFNICAKFWSRCLGMVSVSGLPIFCAKAQAGETPHSAEFLLLFALFIYKKSTLLCFYDMTAPLEYVDITRKKEIKLLDLT